MRWSKDSLIKLSRLKDVLMMMIMFHIWPEQTYRFSTRKFLPCKKNRFSKESKPVIPFDLLKSKSSNIPMMKEINVVGIGQSFDLNNLRKFDGPIFLCSFWGPLRIDKNGNIFYKHFYSYKTREFIGDSREKKIEKLFNESTSREYKHDNLIYVNARKLIIENFKKCGSKTLSITVYATDKNGNLYPLNEEWETPSYLNMFDHNQYKLVAMAEKVYKPPLLPPYPHWAPTSSFLAFLCALSFFAKKINVYGWDYYLDSSPENMSYWQLFFKMYKYIIDIGDKSHGGGYEYFERALVNFYYGYQFSKLPHIKIHGYMGKLGKHHKLIKRIERVLFN